MNARTSRLHDLRVKLFRDGADKTQVLDRSAMRPRPIYLIGDSSVLIYSDRIIESRTSELYVLRSVYCAIAAGSLGEDEATLSLPVANALRGVGALIEVRDGFEPLHVSRNDHVLRLSVCDDRPPVDPPLVISFGLLDAGRIARDLEHEDIVLPAAIEEEFEVPPICLSNEDDACSAPEALSLVFPRLEGFAAGCRALRAMGFSRIAVLSIAPITTDLLEIRKFYQAFYIPVLPSRLTYRFVYKLLLLINFALMRICESEGVHFINRWSSQTRGGLAREGLLLDAIHLTGDAALETGSMILNWLDTTPAQAPTGTINDSREPDWWRCEAVAGVSFSARPSVLPGGPTPSTVSLSWNASGRSTQRVKIYVKNPKKEEELFALVGGEGSVDTGPWVFPGTVFILKDAEDDAKLATLVIGHARPEIPW